MNLSQLRHLLAVAEFGSFSRAADACHLTQPALSRSIRGLEDELGLRLIDRVGKRNELTVAGRSVIERARRIVFEATELAQIAPQLAAGLSGAIGVGLGSGPGAVLSVSLLAHFGREYSRLKLTVSRASTALLVQSLRERALDALVVDARSLAPERDLAIEMLPEMRAGFLCRAGHPLAGRKNVGFEALSAYPIASSPLSEDVARMLVEDFGARGHPKELVGLCCDDIESLLQASIESDAVYLGILAAARRYLDSRKLVAVRLARPFLRTARFAIVTLAGRTPPPAMRLVLAFVRERMRD